MNNGVHTYLLFLCIVWRVRPCGCDALVYRLGAPGPVPFLRLFFFLAYIVVGSSFVSGCTYPPRNTCHHSVLLGHASIHSALAITNPFVPDIGYTGCSWERPVTTTKLSLAIPDSHQIPDRTVAFFSAGITSPCSHTDGFGFNGKAEIV